ncbi:unnamed protein product [Vicia faba]|uniref:RRM domain-containing protein n=1 Tax=Vicia faba TaxID=3906 RepID=A0AAV1B700_VICFA|nr:unnamed protein product [Vicia faba]
MDMQIKWDVSTMENREKKGKWEKISSFYFSEIPDFTKAGDILQLFGCIGEVIEVVIPPRRNKVGKKFGFARFQKVEDEKVFVVKLDNVMIEGRKIHANLPRFDRKAEGSRSEDVKRGKFRVLEKTVGGVKGAIVGGSVYREGNRSFVDMVSNKTRNVSGGQGDEKSRSFNFSSSPEDLNRLRNAFVGVVLESGMTYNVQNSFEIEGYFSIKVMPLGASLCLLEEVEEGAIIDLIKEGKS